MYIIGAGMTPLGKFKDQSVVSLTEQAVTQAMLDAELKAHEIDAAFFANTRQPMLEGQNTIRGQIALRPLGFEKIAISNHENACASGSTALYHALAHVRAGMAGRALVVGAEKMVFKEKREAMFAAFMGGTDISMIDETSNRLRDMAKDVIPDVSASTKERSFFMDIYAAFARLHMQTYGTSARDFAALAAKNHQNAVHNKRAQYRHAMSVDEVLADKPVVYPFTRSMCAPMSDGAAALVIAHGSLLTPAQKKRAVEIRGMSLVSGAARPPEDFEAHLSKRAGLLAYEESGVSPSDVNVCEVHDATSYAELVQIENLGLLPRGSVGARLGEISRGGRVPVNVSGGLVSKGHPVAATGVIQLVELCEQLRGEAGACQVEGARVALAENGGGFYDTEEAATTVTVLVK